MPSPPTSSLFPYTTLFRSTPLRALPLGERLRPLSSGRERTPRSVSARDSTDRKSTRLNSSHLGISYAVSTDVVSLSLHDALPIYTIAGIASGRAVEAPLQRAGENTEVS